MIAGSFLIAIFVAIFIDWSLTNAYVDIVEAKEEVVEPQEVKIQVVIDWTRERIEKEIRNTFPETPNTALAIVGCESGFNPNAQSNHTWRGERERSWGLFQIHQDSWEKKAISLGLPDYKTDIQQNIKMARYIYDNAGQRWSDWSCYSKGMI